MQWSTCGLWCVCGTAAWPLKTTVREANKAPVQNKRARWAKQPFACILVLWMVFHMQTSFSFDRPNHAPVSHHTGVAALALGRCQCVLPIFWAVSFMWLCNIMPWHAQSSSHLLDPLNSIQIPLISSACFRDALSKSQGCRFYRYCSFSIHTCLKNVFVLVWIQTNPASNNVLHSSGA